MINELKKYADKQFHKHMVSQAIFCPQCGAVLDTKTATSVTVWKDNKPVYSKTFCSTHLQPDYQTAQKAVCQKNGLRAEFYHGKGNKLEVIE